MASRRVSLKGRGADIFFGDYTAAPPAEDATPPDPTPARDPSNPPAAGDGVRPPVTADHEPAPAVALARSPASSPASERASKLAPTATTPRAAAPAAEPQLVELIRRMVKVPGREVSFIRLTAAEKARLADVAYSYKRKGKRITETDIARIGLNFILEDHDQRHGESVLARVIDALLA